MTASSCVIVSENERRPYAGSQISARGAVRAFEPCANRYRREFAAFVSLDISRYKRLAEDMGLAGE